MEFPPTVWEERERASVAWSKVQPREKENAKFKSEFDRLNAVGKNKGTQNETRSGSCQEFMGKGEKTHTL